MNDKKILFINSYQRSGSTLLGMLLDYHRAITYLGEVRNVHEYLEHNKTDFNGELLSECKFWRTIFRELPDDPHLIFTKVRNEDASHNYSVRMSNFLGSPLVDKILAWLSPGFRQELRAHKNIRKYYTAASKVTHAKWLVDSSHRTIEAKDHIQALGDNMKVIFLTRDGRGVINSVMKRTGKKAAKASRQWKRFIFKAKRFHEKLASDQYITIRYEDLCVDPLNELDKIADFLGIEKLGQQLEQKEKDHHFVGGSSTLRDRGKKELAIQLDEKWRESMNGETLAIFERTAGDVNRSLGYGK